MSKMGRFCNGLAEAADASPRLLPIVIKVAVFAPRGGLARFPTCLDGLRPAPYSMRAILE